tara:strand:- start:1264 stop:1920 length:657 start_codon:yes stop_codon:yes gene_type:complete
MKNILNICYSNDTNLEIGIDEAGRGPMFGRVYSAAVLLPKMDYKYELMKDSKRFSSERKLLEVADYIKKNAILWGIGYATEKEVDELNIRKATHKAMHRAIDDLFTGIQPNIKYHLLVDGNDFTPYTFIENETLVQVPHTTIEGGDNKYCSIAAASILAKVARDDYIKQLCREDNNLDEKYGLLKNKGYGTKIHLDGIKKYGITDHHRKTFGCCQQYT